MSASSTSNVTISPPLALERLSRGLASYQIVSGRTATQILVQKGGQLLYGNRNPKFGATFYGLVQLFLDQAPPDDAIRLAARARGFRMGRRNYTTSGVGAGISPTALKRAQALMGGYKAIIVNVNPYNGAAGVVRIGVRGKRVHFRHGRLSYALSGEGYGPLQEDDKRVNLRAVATIMEIILRTSGRHFLGSSYVHKRWRAFAKPGYVPAGTPGLASGPGVPSRQFGETDWRLVNNNPRSFVTPLGDAQLTADADKGNAQLRITSNVPGVQAIGQTRGLFSKAIAGVTQDLEAYLARKEKEAVEAQFK
jgi:hypothetical protein